LNAALLDPVLGADVDTVHASPSALASITLKQPTESYFKSPDDPAL
jgi:hypothetical protein